MRSAKLACAVLAAAASCACLACGCAPRSGVSSASAPAGSAAPGAPGDATAVAEPTPGPTYAVAAPAVATAKAMPADARRELLTLPQARAYMVKLVNRDRASMGLPPVVLDEGAGTRAGQGHAEDMAARGYLGHWGSDGSVPEERYTDAGGTDMVLENASCFTDEKPRTLDHGARIDPRNLDEAEDMFFHESPPHDGHRKNILKPWHKSVGIGIAQPAPTPTEIPVPCIAQEFIDSYGTYATVPRKMHVGDTLRVSGTMGTPATFAGVGLARVDAPAPISVAELNRRRSYPVPAPYQMYWPPGYKTPIPVTVSGARFAVDLPVSDHGQPGLYELSTWATVPGSSDFVMVSLRTILVRP